LLSSYQSISPDPILWLWIFRNKDSFSQWGVVTPRPTSKLEYHPLSAVRDCIFSIFAATLHIGGRSSIRNRRTRHAVMTGAHLTLGSHVLECCQITFINYDSHRRSTFLQFPGATDLRRITGVFSRGRS
jgi:hypothetical protein